jgi:hypothetical protein
MNQNLFRLAVGAVVASCAPAITAADVSLLPPSQTITVGQTAFVDVQVSGIKPAAIAAFDFTFGYDPALLQVGSVAFGSNLDLGTSGSLQTMDASVPGEVFVFEVSFEDSSLLTALQPDSFSLVTIGFLGLAPGVVSLSQLFGSLSDELANRLSYDFQGASITIESGNTGPGAIPESGTIWSGVLLGGLVAASVYRAKRRTTGSPA